ncbi:hypothetical protein OG225_43255 (plasmid) [Nocardia sp. NBC_01377]|uniref:hypothetical protein n=1 Tax=Nocardia sp. NBC_01377 TaxID=2903595 RepID=UPI00324DE9E9
MAAIAAEIADMESDPPGLWLDLEHTDEAEHEPGHASRHDKVAAVCVIDATNGDKVEVAEGWGGFYGCGEQAMGVLIEADPEQSERRTARLVPLDMHEMRAAVPDSGAFHWGGSYAHSDAPAFADVIRRYLGREETRLKVYDSQ